MIRVLSFGAEKRKKKK